jgi:hypothetical protein
MQKRRTSSLKRTNGTVSVNTNIPTTTTPMYRRMLKYEKMKVFRAKVLEDLVHIANEYDMDAVEVYSLLQNGQFETTGPGAKKRFFFDHHQTACDVLKAFDEPVENYPELVFFSGCESASGDNRNSIILLRDANIRRIHVNDDNIILLQW